MIHPDKVILEIPTPGEEASAAEIAAAIPLFEGLRQRGFRLAFDQNLLRRAYVNWLPMASFIKLEHADFSAGKRTSSSSNLRAHHYGAKSVAKKVRHKPSSEHMHELGVKLFQGFWVATPDLVHTRTVRPSQAIILQLINLVRNQSSTAEIEDLLKKDPTLSFNLLRFINSSGFRSVLRNHLVPPCGDDSWT